MALDALSGVVGPVQYSSPRGVQVRPPDDLNKMQNAVYGSVAIYADTLTESKAVIAAWPEIMAAMSEAASEVLARVAETIAEEARKAAEVAEQTAADHRAKATESG